MKYRGAQDQKGTNMHLELRAGARVSTLPTEYMEGEGKWVFYLARRTNGAETCHLESKQIGDRKNKRSKT